MRRRFHPTSAALVALALVGFFSTLWYFVRTTGGQSFDSKALRGQDLQLPAVIRASGTSARLGLVFGAGIVSVLILLALAHGRSRAALMAVIIAAGSFLTTQAIKMVVSRPGLVLVTIDDRHGNSFPSGHSSLAFSLAIALIIVSPTRLRGLAAVIGAPFATLIGAATVFARWHRPSDVIGAAFVVMTWTFATLLVLGRANDAASRRRFPCFTMAALALIGAAFVVGFSRMTSDGLSKRLLIVDAQQGRAAVDVADAFKVATSSIAVAACVLVALALAVVNRIELVRTKSLTDNVRT